MRVGPRNMVISARARADGSPIERSAAAPRSRARRRGMARVPRDGRPGGAAERQPQLLLLGRPLRILGLPDQEVQVLERDQRLKLIIHGRAVPGEWSGSYRSWTPRGVADAVGPSGRT